METLEDEVGVGQGPNSSTLRMGADKSGVGGGEWKVSSMQISILFVAKDFAAEH